MTKLKKRKDERLLPQSDESFAFIAGYTPAGFPYGVTWEEACKENDIIWQEASDASTDVSTGKSELFPAPITALPKADIPLEGITAYLSQSDNHQVVFMHFEKDVQLPEHSHAAQVGFVLEGKIELTVAGVSTVYTKSDRYHIQAGALHSARIYAGYADITFFNEPNRYKKLHS